MPLVERLNREINQISASPELRTFLDPDGAQPVALAPAAVAGRVKEDLAQLKRIAAERLTQQAEEFFKVAEKRFMPVKVLGTLPPQDDPPKKK